MCALCEGAHLSRGYASFSSAPSYMPSMEAVSLEERVRWTIEATPQVSAPFDGDGDAGGVGASA